MSYYTEEDPLLPRDRQAPEIHGSRPQSIKEDYITTETDQLSNDDELDVGRPNRRNFSDYMGLILGLCIFSSLILITTPEAIFRDIFGDRRTGPQTIEQRANKILTENPLIGISPSLLSLSFTNLTVYRRP
jgi:membrane dipeptidase